MFFIKLLIVIIANVTSTHLFLKEINIKDGTLTSLRDAWKDKFPENGRYIVNDVLSIFRVVFS